MIKMGQNGKYEQNWTKLDKMTKVDNTGEN